MSLRWVPLEALEPHPENANRMPDRLLAKLKRHVQRTGRYEPLLVRPLPARHERRPEGRRGVRPRQDSGRPGHRASETEHRYQVLNGHHRARVLKELGHTHARCDVWDVDDEEARVLLATLNRLEGRDDPSARADLVARLAKGRSAEELAALLPEPPDAVERLLALAKPPPDPLSPEALPLPLRPMTFFLTDGQYEVVSAALRKADDVGGRAGVSPDGTPSGDRKAAVGPCRTKTSASRAERLERLARWCLESIGRL